MTSAVCNYRCAIEMLERLINSRNIIVVIIVITINICATAKTFIISCKVNVLVVLNMLMFDSLYQFEQFTGICKHRYPHAFAFVWWKLHELLHCCYIGINKVINQMAQVILL